MGQQRALSCPGKVPPCPEPGLSPVWAAGKGDSVPLPHSGDSSPAELGIPTPGGCGAAGESPEESTELLQGWSPSGAGLGELGVLSCRGEGSRESCEPLAGPKGAPRKFSAGPVAKGQGVMGFTKIRGFLPRGWRDPAPQWKEEFSILCSFRGQGIGREGPPEEQANEVRDAQWTC